MKFFYPTKALVLSLSLLCTIFAAGQSPTTVTQGFCSGVVADFNNSDNGFNSPSIYGGIFDSSFFKNVARGYFTDYNPPFRVAAPGFPRAQSIISPPFNNPNPTGTFNVGFYYIVNNPFVDRFQVRIVSLTQTATGTVTNIEATSGLQSFAAWSTPVPYIDNGPNPTPLLNGFEGFVCLRLVDPDIINSPTTTFRVEVAYVLNSAFFAVFDNFSIGPVNIPLPVNFIGLVASRNTDNLVSLKWDVTEEINVREYQVERSENGSSFSSVGIIAAKGKSIYSFNNTDLSSGNIFYRVKSVDIDGRFKYSSIIKLSANSLNSYTDKIKIYPTPAKDEITIVHAKLTRNARMAIISVDGKILKSITPSTGSSHTFTNINGLAPGLYFLRLEDGIGNIQTVKLLKN